MKKPNFKNLKKLSAKVKIVASYATEDNFTGKVVPGYQSIDLCCAHEAFEKLLKVQKKLESQDLSLIIFDAYRPVKAVEFFKDWEGSENPGLKQKYFPNLTKSEIFENGFVAKRSSHSRGSALDLSIFNLKNNLELDMGTIFDFFGPESATNFENITEDAKKNRQFLCRIMEENGFVNYHKEWWHFRLENEPYPDTYFDYDISEFI